MVWMCVYLWDMLVHHVMIHRDVLPETLRVVFGFEQDEMRCKYPERWWHLGQAVRDAVHVDALLPSPNQSLPNGMLHTGFHIVPTIVQNEVAPSKVFQVLQLIDARSQNSGFATLLHLPYPTGIYVHQILPLHAVWVHNQ